MNDKNCKLYFYHVNFTLFCHVKITLFDHVNLTLFDWVYPPGYFGYYSSIKPFHSDGFSKHIDIISMDSPFCVLKGHRPKFLNCDVFMTQNVVFISAIRVNPDEMPPFVAFYPGFTVCQSSCLPLSKMKRVDIDE